MTIELPRPEVANAAPPPPAALTTARAKRPELLLRVLSALVLLPIVIALIARGGLPFAVLVGAVAGWSVYEVLAMALRPLPAVAWVAVLSACGLPIWTGLRAGDPEALPFGFTAACGLALAAGFVSSLMADDPVAAVGRAVWMPASLVYCALPLSLIGLLRMERDGLWWVALTCAVTWMNDTGAYFAGRALGRHKLLPRVSPHKTWEGFGGGLLASIATALAVKVIGFGALGFQDCLALGLLAGIVGPLGDLSESLLKRSLKVKDSGHLLPGHGGILDRIDALLFNGALVFAYAGVFGRL